MFSGGIDSTGALHHLLTDEQYASHPLIVHHIHIHNRENRARAEAHAVGQIIDYYKKNANRDFLVTQSTFNALGFHPLRATRFPYDADVIAFYAANITTARKDIGQVVVGRTKTDVESGGNYSDRMRRRQKIFDAVWILEKEKAPAFYYPIIALARLRKRKCPVMWEVRDMPSGKKIYEWNRANKINPPFSVCSPGVLILPGYCTNCSPT